MSALRPNSPSPMSLRRRRGSPASASAPLQRAQRRNSALSDSVSEARNTIRSSTDELFFPRAAASRDDDAAADDEESHWHSAPLGLALLPAIAGVFFQNGSSFVTDVTLLALAAVFLNWSVRLPWEWYRSARTIRRQDTLSETLDPGLNTDLSDAIPDAQENEPTSSQQSKPPSPPPVPPPISAAATRELQIHELAALASCFICPVIGTWVLHHIRSKLSRPSEGLVSNYNLTIFLLAAEIRPFSHLLKMVQARTLHLQRIVASSSAAADDDDNTADKIDPAQILDLSKRLEELEAHIAETAASRLSPPTTTLDPQNQNQDQKPPLDNHTLTPAPTQKEEYTYTQSLLTTATSAFQSDIDALTRAVRKYEKRTTLMAHETEKRLVFLESKTRDALALAAAAAQHSTADADAKKQKKQKQPGILAIVLQFASAAFWLPIQVSLAVVGVPVSASRWVLAGFRDLVLPRQIRERQGERERGLVAKYPPGKGKAKAQAPQIEAQAQSQSRRPASAQQKRAKREREREQEREWDRAAIIEED
ncbi:uncharacterized protein BJX67DRAFT_367278 [Aspergillus lucknowensis]|uniref:Uncharacterized protein n=1 Tax=Aspergillus lucknowensis TaxID=176173 RepID=A0ABR4L9A7_9EURO